MIKMIMMAVTTMTAICDKDFEVDDDDDDNLR